MTRPGRRSHRRSTPPCTPLSARRARFPPVPSAGTRAPLYEAYRATGNYVSADGRVVLLDVGLAAGDLDTTGAMNAIPAIRADIAALARSIGATAWGVAGHAPVQYDMSTTSSSDLARVIPLAIVVIGVLRLPRSPRRWSGSPGPADRSHRGG